VSPPDIATSRAALRAFRLEDIDSVMAYASDPEVSRFVFAMPFPYTRSDAAAFLESCIAKGDSDHHNWAIVHEGKVIGGVDSNVELVHRRAEFGYALHRAYWGMGLATEVTSAVIAWTFDHFDVDRVCAYGDARNAASRHVLEKCGLTYEGTLRKHRVHRGESVDQFWYGMLRTEWEARRELRARPSSC